eukprot:TRINITY_DN38423_c0_g1_i1.p1 TRINITY_DN38423_c0_g1~~TRINITY_DN38423_c0_g1_i1.p1  ORF type:complete len:192 (-),score=17.44 TRINITY_DN38423_c0_g1_i1:138-632(-)
MGEVNALHSFWKARNRVDMYGSSRSRSAGVGGRRKERREVAFSDLTSTPRDGAPARPEPPTKKDCLVSTFGIFGVSSSTIGSHLKLGAAAKPDLQPFGKWTEMGVGPVGLPGGPRSTELRGRSGAHGQCGYRDHRGERLWRVAPGGAKARPQSLFFASPKDLVL